MDWFLYENGLRHERVKGLSSILHIHLATIRMQRSLNATIYDEITLIGKDQINVRGRIWQNMCRFTNKLT